MLPSLSWDKPKPVVNADTAIKRLQELYGGTELLPKFIARVMFLTDIDYQRWSIVCDTPLEKVFVEGLLGGEGKGCPNTHDYTKQAIRPEVFWVLYFVHASLILDLHVQVMPAAVQRRMQALLLVSAGYSPPHLLKHSVSGKALSPSP